MKFGPLVSSASRRDGIGPRGSGRRSGRMARRFTDHCDVPAEESALHGPIKNGGRLSGPERACSSPELLGKGSSKRNGSFRASASGHTKKGRDRRRSGLRGSLTSLASMISNVETVLASNRNETSSKSLSKEVLSKPVMDEAAPQQRSAGGRRAGSRRFLFRMRRQSSSSLSTATLSTAGSSTRTIPCQGPNHPKPISPSSDDGDQSECAGTDRCPTRQGRRRSSLLRIPDDFETLKELDECSELTGPTKQTNIDALPGKQQRRRSSPCRITDVLEMEGNHKENCADIKLTKREASADLRPVRQGRRRSSLVRIPDGIDYDDAHSECSDLTCLSKNASVDVDPSRRGKRCSSLVRFPEAIEIQAVSTEEESSDALACKSSYSFDFECAEKHNLDSFSKGGTNEDSKPPAYQDSNFNRLRSDDMRPARQGRRRSSLFSIPDGLDIKHLKACSDDAHEENEDYCDDDVMEVASMEQDSPKSLPVAANGLTPFHVKQGSAPPHDKRRASLSNLPSPAADETMLPLGFSIPRRLSLEMMRSQQSEPAFIRPILDQYDEGTDGTAMTDTASESSDEDREMVQQHVLESDVDFSIATAPPAISQPLVSMTPPEQFGSRPFTLATARTHSMPASAIEMLIAASDLNTIEDDGENGSNDHTAHNLTENSQVQASSSTRNAAPLASRSFLDRLQNMDHRQVLRDHQEGQATRSFLREEGSGVERTTGLAAVTSSWARLASAQASPLLPHAPSQVGSLERIAQHHRQSRSARPPILSLSPLRVDSLEGIAHQQRVSSHPSMMTAPALPQSTPQQLFSLSLNSGPQVITSPHPQPQADSRTRTSVSEAHLDAAQRSTAVWWNTTPSNPSGGSTPLYHAVSSRAPIHTIQSLIDADPSSTGTQNGGGLTPIHCGIERYDTSIDVLRMLLEANPATARIRSLKGQTPVDLLWKRFVEPEPFRSEETKDAARQLRRIMEAVVADDGYSSGGCTMPADSKDLPHKMERKPCHKERARKANSIRALYSSMKLQEFWDLMTLFIKAAHHNTVANELPSDQGQWRLVHAAVAVGCAPLLIRFAVALHPEQIRQREEQDGRLPLHIAASAQNLDEFVESDKCSICTLVALYPGAASCHDGKGRLPLSLAVENRKSWNSTKALFLSSPRSLSTSDSEMHMPPFMIAAVGADADAIIVYRLLRENPLEVTRGICWLKRSV